MVKKWDQTEELHERICGRIAQGESLRTICLDDDMPDRVTIIKWLNVDSALATKYARARIDQADYLLDEMSDIENKTLDGTYEPNVSKVVLGSKQWRAMKLAPKKYGANLIEDQNHKVEIVISGGPTPRKLETLPGDDTETD